MFYMYAYSDSDMRCEQARRFAGHGVTEDKALQPNTPELLDLNVLLPGFPPRVHLLLLRAL